jgi:FkbM family methyltransferase
MEKLGPTDVFFDVGAYVGFYSVIATVACSVAEVHAFDIDPTNLELISSSLGLNGTRPGSVQLVSAAIGANTGMIVGFGPHKTGNLSTQQVMGSGSAEGASADRKALSLSLDEYCKQMRVKPTFVKIDIEGAEAFAVDGMHWVLRVAEPKILIEVHPELIGRYGRSVNDVLSTLAAYGYVGGPLEDSRTVSEGRPKSTPILPFGPTPTIMYLEKPL